MSGSVYEWRFVLLCSQAAPRFVSPKIRVHTQPLGIGSDARAPEEQSMNESGRERVCIRAGLVMRFLV